MKAAFRCLLLMAALLVLTSCAPLPTPSPELSPLTFLSAAGSRVSRLHTILLQIRTSEEGRGGRVRKRSEVRRKLVLQLERLHTRLSGWPPVRFRRSNASAELGVL